MKIKQAEIREHVLCRSLSGAAIDMESAGLPHESHATAPVTRTAPSGFLSFNDLNARDHDMQQSASNSAMVDNELVLSLNVDELAVLPEKPSVEELLAYEGSCRTQLVPEVISLASAISEGAVGAVAGPYRPDSWSPDPPVTMRSVNLFKVQGAYYFPEYGVLIDRMGRAMRSSMSQASYVTPDLLRLPHIRKVENEIVFTPPKRLERLSSAVITMSWGGLRNYGHFLTDCLSSVGTLLGIEHFRDHDFVFPVMKQWHREHLQILGVSPIELPHQCYYVESGIFTDCMASFLQAPNRNLRLAPDRQLSALGCRRGGSRKIYLSRRDNAKRRFLSEERLETILRGKGFEILRPETMSVQDTIAVFASSAAVVCCSGATFSNALYCPPGAVVVVIQPWTMGETWIRNICLQMDLKWAPYFCESRPPEKPVVHGGKVRPEIGISFDVDLDDFLAYLDQVTQKDRLPFWRRPFFWK